MTTKNTGMHIERGIYDSPFDAFTNYMNIVGDFISRVNAQYPEDIDNEELNSLLKMISNQNEEIAALNKELTALKNKSAKAAKAVEPKEKPAKKSCRKKAEKPEK